MFDYCFSEGIYQIKCYSTSDITISACTTSNNNGSNNTKYGIVDRSNNTYIILFDLENKQIGYRIENEKDMKIVHKEINPPIYLMVESDYEYEYFEIKDIEKIK